MGYTITFSDVMTVVISGALTIIVWFLKSYLSNIQATNEQQNKKLAEIDEKTQRRINAVEEESRNEIKRVDRELADIKGDFATMFVLREDYFRAMDKMDGNFRDIQIAKMVFHLRMKRVKYWDDLIVEVHDLLQKWRDSDADRSRRMKSLRR